MFNKNKTKTFIHYLPVYGCISTGIIYVSIGVVAILSFLKLKQGGADESSLIAFLNDYFIGKIFIWVILLGTLSYIAWRFYESINDPYNYGKDAIGITRRIGIGMSSIADALIAFTAIQIIVGGGNVQKDGDPEEQRQMVSSMLNESWGVWAVIAIGVIICLTALVQFYYGITQGYKERLDISHFSSRAKSTIHVLAWIGYFSRGIILGIIGFFFIKAGILETSKYIVNTDKAFDYIGDHVGHVYFILVALGTVCYGLFMFTHGAAHDADNDDEEMVH